MPEHPLARAVVTAAFERNVARTAIAVAMAAVAASVTAIFFSSPWGLPALFIDSIPSVGRPLPAAPAPQRA